MPEDINVTITEPEIISIQIIEAEPINIIIGEGIPSLVDLIFEPPEGAYRIVKLYIEGGKVKVEYEVI